MVKPIRVVVLGLALGMCLSVAYPRPTQQCAEYVVCPEHNSTRATFTGQTRGDNYGKCTYGLYTHLAMDANGHPFTHNFWVTCNCR
jgi:hypothetical protein